MTRRFTGTKRKTMHVNKKLKCARCDNFVYVTNLCGRLYCRTCREYLF